jgi:hypothetical protein
MASSDFARKDACWLAQSAGSANLMPFDVTLHISTTSSSRSHHIPSDLFRPLRLDSHLKLCSYRTVATLAVRSRAPRRQQRIGALGHEPHLSSVSEPYQRTVDRRV